MFQNKKIVFVQIVLFRSTYFSNCHWIENPLMTITRKRIQIQKKLLQSWWGSQSVIAAFSSMFSSASDVRLNWCRVDVVIAMLLCPLAVSNIAEFYLQNKDFIGQQLLQWKNKNKNFFGLQTKNIRLKITVLNVFLLPFLSH